jgi:chromosome segregation ATPase
MLRFLQLAGFVVALVAVGCTSPCQYIRQANEAEANLDLVRSRKNALELEVRSLRDLNDKLVANADTLSAELNDLRIRRNAVQQNGNEEMEEPAQDALKQTIKNLTDRNLVLQRQYEAVEHQMKRLATTVTRYEKELKELQRIPSFTDRDLKRYQ